MAASPRRRKTELPLPTLIDLFILSKQIEGRSPKTLTWYRAKQYSLPLTAHP